MSLTRSATQLLKQQPNTTKACVAALIRHQSTLSSVTSSTDSSSLPPSLSTPSTSSSSASTSAALSSSSQYPLTSEPLPGRRSPKNYTVSLPVKPIQIKYKSPASIASAAERVPVTYTTGLSRLREHYKSTLQEDLMVMTYNHNFKTKEKVPEGIKVELKGNKHVKPMVKASSSKHVPELLKIDVHCMMKEALTSKYNLLSGFMAIQSITGEMPEVILAKKGVHTWKLRAGNPIGCKVTLKGDKMYQFLDKLIEVVLPRMKEWPGLPESAGDATGNIGMGFPPSAMSLFPEIENNFDMFPRMTGFDVTFSTSARTNLEARLLLSGFNMPFQVKHKSVVPAPGAPVAAVTAAAAAAPAAKK